MTTYQHITVATPPVLTKRDGKWFIQIIHGDLTLEAPVGAWFMSEVMVRLIVPTVFPPEIPTLAPEGSPSDQNQPPVPPREG